MKESKHQYKYAVRRLKKADDSIQFVNSILRGGVNIFSEIKKFRDDVGSPNISDQNLQQSL